ncbi:MAG: DUF2207 domain-containing protein [Candidatus Stygibacter frigidus]|nr:DUF2207 domain-containing protein [Candidatus Stygibacter frigidus]
MKKTIILLIILILAALLQGKSFYAQDYNCMINIRENGDLLVREVFRYHFSGDTYSWVSRYIPERATDGLEFIRAFVKDTDGNIISEVDNYKFDDDNMVVRWNFEPIMDASLDFELEFIARHVLYIEDSMLIVDFQPLPRDHDFIIDQGRIELVLPGKLPSPMGVFSNTSNKVNVSYSANSVIYNFYNLEGDEVFPVGFTVSDDALPIEKPHWQEIDEIQSYYGKYLILLLIAVLIAALLLAIKLIGVSRRHKIRFTPDQLPDDLFEHHPGLVSKLANGFDNSVVPFASLFFRLLKQDSVVLEKTAKKKYRVLLTENVPDDALDKSFYEILQQLIDKDITDLKKIFSKLYKFKKDMNYNLMVALYDGGYVDEEQHRKQKKLHIWVIVSLVFVFIAGFGGIISFSYGLPLMLFCSFPLAIIFIYLIYKASLIEVNTPKGFEEKYTWELWKKNMLHDLKKNKEKINLADFDSIFPFALVLGFASKYIDHFKKSGIDLTESILMQHFDSVEDFNSFIAVYIAIAASTGSSGSSGGAGGGAGGGGASAG